MLLLRKELRTNAFASNVQLAEIERGLERVRVVRAVHEREVVARALEVRLRAGQVALLLQQQPEVARDEARLRVPRAGRRRDPLERDAVPLKEGRERKNGRSHLRQ